MTNNDNARSDEARVNADVKARAGSADNLMNRLPPLVLATGASGWFGRNLVNALLRGLPDTPELARPRAGLRVRILVQPGQAREDFGGANGAVEIIEGDVRDPEACASLTRGGEGATLFHIAGVIHPARVREFYEVNEIGTENVLAAAIKAGVKRVVATSSNSPCGLNAARDEVFTEDSPHRPYMNYGRSKMKMELAVRRAGEAGAIETVLIRAPWFYGPRQPDRQLLFFRMVRDGKAPIVGDGGNRRSMAYTDNLAQGHLRAALTPEANGRVYWIADSEPHTMNEIVDTIERLLETEFGQTCAHKRMRLPGIASEVAVAVDAALQAVGLYHTKIHVLGEMNKTIACSVERAERELGYRPAIGLEEGMRRSLAWAFERQGGI